MQQIATPEHLVTLAVIAGATAVLSAAARITPGAWTTLAARGLAVVLVVNELSWQVVTVGQQTWSSRTDLPINLCDIACFVAAAALWSRDRGLIEVTWFWGLAGCVQALITPDTGSWHFPDYGFVQYYVAHAAIVAAAVYLVCGLGLSPRVGAVRRVALATLLAAIVAAAGDALTGGDYMFLLRRPAGGSVLDLFGPWPLYLGGAAAVALVLFTLLDLPFRPARQER